MSQISDVAAINREELAWAAGFFDGEGCIRHKTTTVKSKSQRGGQFRSDLAIDVRQSDAQALHRFHSAVLGRGNVHGPYGPYDTRPTSRPHWCFRASGFENVQAVMAMLWPFLSPVKKEQMLGAFTSYAAAPVKRLRARIKKAGESP